MFLSRWLKRFSKKNRPSRRGRLSVTSARLGRCLLRLEGLEDRRVPAGLHHFVIEGLEGVGVAGQAMALTVIAQDENNNVVTDYMGTIQFNTNDDQALLPDFFTFTRGDQGVFQFDATLFTSGVHAIRVTDVSNQSLFGSTGGIVVEAGQLDHFDFVTPNQVNAGELFKVWAIAKDAYGNTITDYQASVTFNSSDGNFSFRKRLISEPGDHGYTSFGIVLRNAGHQQIRITHADNQALHGSFGVRVMPTGFASFSVTGMPSAVAGEQTPVTVTALDAFGNPILDYAGTVFFNSSDANATLPREYTFTGADQGSKTFNVILQTAGHQMIRVGDTLDGSSMFGQVSLTVGAAALDHFVVTAPEVTVAGQPFEVTITAMDEFGNVVTDYAGTIEFKATDISDALPVSYTFVPSDTGVHTFVVTLNVEGLQGLRVADASDSALHGGVAVRVEPARIARTAALPHFAVKMTPALNAGLARPTIAPVHQSVVTTPITARELESFVTPAGASLVRPMHDGVLELDLVLNTPGWQTITITSVENPLITATVSLTVVRPGERVNGIRPDVSEEGELQNGDSNRPVFKRIDSDSADDMFAIMASSLDL